MAAAYSSERRAQLLRILVDDGRIDAAQAANDLGVTSETVRKDLIALEKAGRLRRVHGGAVPVERLSFEPNLAARTGQSHEKQAIAKAALAFLPEEGSVFLDAGTTTHALAEAIGEHTRLRFYTNSVPIAMTLLRLPYAQVDLLGGSLRRATVAAVGDRICRMLEEINVDVLFLGTNGCSLSRGLTTPNPDEAAVKRRMLPAAETRILLTDHTKFGLVRGIRHAEISDLDVIISDHGVSESLRSKLTQAGPEVVLAGKPAR